MTGTARPSPAELWQQAGGSAGRYRQLLREHGHLLAPGDEGYDDAPGSPPCGWPRSASQVRRLEATGALAPDETWPDPETLGVLLEAGLRDEDEAGCE